MRNRARFVTSRQHLTHQFITTFANEVGDIKQAVKPQSEQLSVNIHSIDAATSVQREIEDGIDYVENKTRRNNLRINGVMDSPAKTWADTEAAERKTFATSLKFSERQANDIRIERAH